MGWLTILLALLPLLEALLSLFVKGLPKRAKDRAQLAKVLNRLYKVADAAESAGMPADSPEVVNAE